MIYLLTHQLIGGGAEKQLNLFWNYIASNNLSDKFKIFCFSNKGIEDYYNQDSIYVFHTKKASAATKEFLKIIETEKPAIIHFWLPATFSKFWKIALSTKYKKLIGLRSNYSDFSLKRLFYGIIFSVNKNFVSNTHIDDFGTVYKAIFKGKNFFYIPNGLNVTRTKGNEVKEKNYYQILFAGRLIPDKNVFTLLKGFALFLNNYPSSKLVICGDGPLKNAIENKIKDLGIGENVELKGYVSNLEPYFTEAHFFILPSTREGMPNVAFEAALHKCILVVSDIKQNTRWFSHGKNALVFSTMSLQDLVVKLNQAVELSIEAKHQFNSENEKLMHKLSIKAMSENYLKVYSEI